MALWETSELFTYLRFMSHPFAMMLRTRNKICNEWDQRHSNNSNMFIINEYNLHTRSE